MESHIVYIITDSNRAYLEVGYCTDMSTQLQEINHTSSTLFGSSPKLRNVVYIEVFEKKEKALSYHSTLRHFTRMQREKLIRLKNPNWLNLHASPSHTNRPDNKKVAVYA
ncbi:GIY-YIG nuclease family protein [Sphingobacterium sp. SGR-19]|uniref:GIY-YIG nuclease family protein n=1 Tax=Sphingobacterium sp. SGR-19 TaxID=2710886 RepID=UPI0013EAA266|nr:GIY-YIG nuclease family protein [Sphingobacterium sp. SGR-19]NGM64020.1 GIY-YIG nuclease family protein [Sphingobacterium sp. SGR-19]